MKMMQIKIFPTLKINFYNNDNNIYNKIVNNYNLFDFLFISWKQKSKRYNNNNNSLKLKKK